MLKKLTLSSLLLACHAVLYPAGALASDLSVGLRIDCGNANDQGVEVMINGEFKGECPVDVFVGPGHTKIEARKDWANGHYDYAVNEQRLAANTNKRIQLELRPFEKPGRIGAFMNNDDGTVTDTRTNLTWQRCSVGQRWSGSSCDGSAAEFTWAEAMRLGSSGWRLPTVDELDTLVVCSSGSRRPSARPGGQYVTATNGECQGNYTHPTLDLRVFPNTPANWFWSSSPNANGSGHAWGVDFRNGSVNFSFKGYSGRVRLVRAGQ